MSRFSEFWHGRGGIAIRRGVVLLLRVAMRLLATLIWQLRLLWARISPRARIFVIIIALVFISGWTHHAFPGVSEVAQALGVLLLASVGFWWIVTAPFKSRRWW